MGFDTISDPFVAAALWSGIAAAAATVLLMVSIVGARLGLLWSLAIERRATARWNPLIAQCAERVPDSLPSLRTEEVGTFLILWCRAQESLRGEAQEQLRALGQRLGIAPRAQRLLRSGKLRRELLGLITLGHLRERSAIPLLLRLVPEAPPVLSLTAAQALIRIDASLGVPCVLDATRGRDDWSLAPVASMLRECDPARVGHFLAAAVTDALRHEGGAGVARLLRLHVASQAEVLRPAVLEALERAPGTEALAAALTALWHPLDATHARRLLEHPEAGVRVAAARALARFGGEEDFERLCRALSDRDWWVRYRAAQALCALPGMDAARLRVLASHLEDRYAADMLRQALSEREAA